ncbi:MAG: MucR family transcriptional regulator [Clostridiales bacterium]|jgi:hypothetical protein|nr:MucR family transcriptional regulator [Clostridiales bacterium]
MPKTDKELTAEIVISYVSSWHQVSGRAAITGPTIVDMINLVYKTIHALDGDEVAKN